MRDHSPIPPPRVPKSGAPRGDPYGRDDRRAPPPGMGRRRRSVSPPYRGREEKRHRRDDDYYRERQHSPRRRHSPDYGRGYEAGYDDYYQQPPPPPKRGGGGVDERSTEPKNFKRFLLENVPDNVNPLEAQKLYEQYLTEHFGDQLRARFEQEKSLDGVRAMYHPSVFEASLARHKEEAAATAQQLAEDLREGRLDPSSSNFNQGMQEPAEQSDKGEPFGPAPVPEGPVCLWKPDRVAYDYKSARCLVAVVDFQRGLQLADNPLLPAVEAAGGPDTAADADPLNKDGDDADAAAASKTADDSLQAVLKEIEGEEVIVADEDSLLLRLNQLDLLLTWLWRVHGIDYYGGKELLLEAEYLDRGRMSRTVRGQRPEEGEEQDEAEAKADREELADRVDKVWTARLEGPDPLEQGCKREEIEERLNDYVESQIRKENDKKWGSTFSNKFFLEKRFVVKHIYNKHQQRLEEQRDVIRDELYWLAYEKANKTKHAAERELIKQQEAERAAAAVAAGDARLAEASDWQEGYEGEEGYVAAPAVAAGGRGPGRLGPMRGRGTRGGLLGRGTRTAVPEGISAAAMMSGLPIVDPAQMMMMGGMPGPIILPGPGMIPALPGALPMGAPMIIDPSMMAGDMGGMPMFIPAQGRRGMVAGRGAEMGGRGRGTGRSGRGMSNGGMAAPPGTKLEGPGYLKHYYDLDAPANNRAVLDYGDL